MLFQIKSTIYQEKRQQQEKKHDSQIKELIIFDIHCYLLQ